MLRKKFSGLTRVEQLTTTSKLKDNQAITLETNRSQNYPINAKRLLNGFSLKFYTRGPSVTVPIVFAGQFCLRRFIGRYLSFCRRHVAECEHAVERYGAHGTRHCLLDVRLVLSLERRLRSCTLKAPYCGIPPGDKNTRKLHQTTLYKEEDSTTDVAPSV